MELDGKRALIIGIGKTGTAVTRFLRERNVLPVVTDEKGFSSGQIALADIVGRVEYRDYAACTLDDIDLVIPSPGVPPFNPLLQTAVVQGIPVLSELELASRFLTEPIVAITGTNGKTTVTTLIGEILAHSGKRVFVGGNIGTPLIGCIDDKNRPFDVIVAEVSSFQLQWTETFRPHVAVLLNVTCDHTDYHGSMAAYREAKEKIFANQTGDDLAILNGDESETAALIQRLGVETKCFSTLLPMTNGMSLTGGRLCDSAPDRSDECYPLGMIRIPGSHNIENVMAAILAVRKCGCSQEAIIESVSRFTGVAHRIAFCGQVCGVRYYDDSKGDECRRCRARPGEFFRPDRSAPGGTGQGRGLRCPDPADSTTCQESGDFWRGAGSDQRTGRRGCRYRADAGT